MGGNMAYKWKTGMAHRIKFNLLDDEIYLEPGDFLILEGVKDWENFYSEILNDPIQWKKGFVFPSTKPGLGVELNEKVANKNTYSGTKLHLEMAKI